MKIEFHFSAIPTVLKLLREDQFPALFINLNSTWWIAYNRESKPADGVYRTGHCIPNENGTWRNDQEQATHWCSPGATQFEQH